MQVSDAMPVENQGINHAAQAPASESARGIAGSMNDAPEAGLSSMSGNSDSHALDMANLSSLAYSTDNHNLADSALIDNFDFDPSHQGLAEQSWDTENRTGAGLPDGYSHVGGTDGGNLDAVANHDAFEDPLNTGDLAPDSNLNYEVFENDAGDLTVAYRGTEPTSVADWATNLTQLFGHSQQYDEAMGLASTLDGSLAEGHDLNFTGHSLGGGLATASAMATDNEATVFNAAGLSDKTLNDEAITQGAGDITNYNVVGDPVSDINGNQDAATVGDGVPGLTSTQQGDIQWLEGMNDHAEWNAGSITDPLLDYPATAVLNHTWHTLTHQLDQGNFA